MLRSGRPAVSPIIATLLLIAIAVAAGIVVYVYVNGLAGGLTQAGGQQVSEQVSMDAYSFSTLGSPSFVVRNVGGSTVTISSVFYDGNLCQASGVTCTAAPSFSTGTCTTGGSTSTCAPGEYVSVGLSVTASSSGSSHMVKVITSDGGTFTFSIVAGRSG